MTFKKAEICPIAGGPPISVLFNPSQYGIDASFTLIEKPVLGGKPAVQAPSGQARSLSMELMFDTYEQGTSVSELTDRIYSLVEAEPSTHHPPIVDFKWGGFQLRCWVERVSGRFTLFFPDGTPARATLNVTFKEYVKDPPDQQSADHTKTYVLQAGDTLAAIAAVEYGEATLWRPIAAANGIDNPRTLAPGLRIVIPPLPERRGSAA